MSEYSKQLIAELSEHLDPNIVEFFEDTKEDNKYEVYSIYELVEYTLVKHFKGETSKEELRKLYDATTRNRRKKKLRWIERLTIDVKQLKQTDEAFPFANLVGQKRFMDKALWKATYGNKTLDDLINEQVEAAKIWSTSAESNFIDFPALSSKSPSLIFESLVSDALICIYHYILEKYDGSIDSYFLSLPKDLIGFPLFAPKKVKLTPNFKDDNQAVDSYEFEGGVLETSTRMETVNDLLLSMDQNDLMILYTSLQSLDVDFYTTKQARVKKRTLAKLFNPRPGKKHYDMMEAHCHRLSKYNFSIISEGRPLYSFNLLDSVDTSDPEEIVFNYGNLLYDNILTNNIANIKYSHMQLLNNNLSTILYQALFKERILLSSKHTDENAELYADYSYNFFASNVRFPNQSRKKNMDIVEESLKEFVENKIIVKSYERKASSTFRIHFYHLSEEERADLEFNRYKNVQLLAEPDIEDNQYDGT